MKGLWRRVWLYGRLAMFVLLLAFVIQLVLINTGTELPSRARIVFWEHDGNNLGALLVAAVLGALVYPLVRLGRTTYRDFRAEKRRRHEEEAEDAWRQAKVRMDSHPVPASGLQEEKAASPPSAASAADIWTQQGDPGEDDKLPDDAQQS
ncbi:MAG: hypothetical protein JXL80_14740 [Planctomycetes bacterium]|nr:hypothetical protein [Planctomycetota bacterium]